MANKRKRTTVRFPPARIKKIMQKDEEVGKVAAAVPIIISRTLELFLESFLKKTNIVARANNAKTLSGELIREVVNSEESYKFLRPLVDSTIKPEKEDEKSMKVSKKVEIKTTDSSSNDVKATTKRGRPKKKVIEKESTVDLADLCDSDEPIASSSTQSEAKKKLDLNELRSTPTMTKRILEAAMKSDSSLESPLSPNDASFPSVSSAPQSTSAPATVKDVKTTCHQYPDELAITTPSDEHANNELLGFMERKKRIDRQAAEDKKSAAAIADSISNERVKCNGGSASPPPFAAILTADKDNSFLIKNAAPVITRNPTGLKPHSMPFKMSFSTALVESDKKLASPTLPSISCVPPESSLVTAGVVPTDANCVKQPYVQLHVESPHITACQHLSMPDPSVSTQTLLPASGTPLNPKQSTVGAINYQQPLEQRRTSLGIQPHRLPAPPFSVHACPTLPPSPVQPLAQTSPLRQLPHQQPTPTPLLVPQVPQPTAIVQSSTANTERREAAPLNVLPPRLPTHTVLRPTPHMAVASIHPYHFGEPTLAPSRGQTCGSPSLVSPPFPYNDQQSGGTGLLLGDHESHRSLLRKHGIVGVESPAPGSGGLSQVMTPGQMRLSSPPPPHFPPSRDDSRLRYSEMGYGGHRQPQQHQHQQQQQPLRPNSLPQQQKQLTAMPPHPAFRTAFPHPFTSSVLPADFGHHSHLRPEILSSSKTPIDSSYVYPNDKLRIRFADETTPHLHDHKNYDDMNRIANNQYIPTRDEFYQNLQDKKVLDNTHNLSH